jgi:hypothetical protein
MFLVKRVTHLPGDSYPIDFKGDLNQNVLSTKDRKVPDNHVLISSDNPIYQVHKAVVPFNDIIGIIIYKLPKKTGFI